MMTDTVPPTVRAFVRPCRACGKPILWTTTVACKRMPVDPAPNPDGNQAVYRDGTGTFRSRVPTDELPVAPHEQLHMPHMATCAPPTADRIRQLGAAHHAGLADGTIVELDTARRRRGRRTPQPTLPEI